MNKPLLQLRQGFSDILIRIVAFSTTRSIRSLRKQQQKTSKQALVLHKLCKQPQGFRVSGFRV